MINNDNDNNNNNHDNNTNSTTTTTTTTTTTNHNNDDNYKLAACATGAMEKRKVSGPPSNFPLPSLQRVGNDKQLMQE